MISLKQIKYALAVADHGHFKRAAEACSISQSALSGAISDMETQLGFQVFERDNKRVLVTKLGEEVLVRARKIHIDVQDLHALASSANAPMSGKLYMGMIPTIAQYLLPKVLPSIRSQYPDLNVVIDEDQSETLVSRVKSGAIDCAVLALPYDCEGLLTLPFWQENFYLLAHKDDALSRRQSVTVSDINLENLLLLEDGHCLKDHALSACRLKPEQFDVEVRANSLGTLINLVANKMGTTFVPEIALSGVLSHQPNLVAIKLDEAGPHRELALILRPSYPRFDSLERLKLLMASCLSGSAP